jgi:hypothetical protein
LCDDADGDDVAWLVEGDTEFKGILSYVELGADNTTHGTPMTMLHNWGASLIGVLAGQLELGAWLRDGIALLQQEMETVARQTHVDLLQLARRASDGLLAAADGLQKLEGGVLTVGAVFAGRVQIAGKWRSALPVGEAQRTKGAEVTMEGVPAIVEAYSPGICSFLVRAMKLLEQFPGCSHADEAEEAVALLQNMLARARVELGAKLQASASAVLSEFGGTSHGRLRH